MQTLPATTQLRDAWEDALEDGVLCPKEITHLSKLIERVDDGVRHALAVLKGGPDAKRAKTTGKDYERLHGPIRIDQYTRTKKHRRECPPTDAA